MTTYFNNFFTKYYAILKVNLHNSSLYKSEFIIMTLRNIFVLVIFVQLYTATFASTPIKKFDNLGLMQVLWLLTIIRMFAQDWTTITLMNNEIRSGEIAYTINRPYSYILFHYASFWGRNLPKIFVDVTSNLIAGYFLIGPLYIPVKIIILCLFMIIIGLTIEFLIQIIIGVLSFWLEDVTALKWVFGKTVTILGGGIIPIAMYPQKLKAILEFLPFINIYYNPARLAVDFNYQLFIKCLVLQLFWLLIISILALALFKKGIKNVSISGG